MNRILTFPSKSRELHNHHFDSTIWNNLKFRDDDIIIATYAKAGTTWVQQMVGQMLFGPDPDLNVADMSVWMDLRIPDKATKLARVESQTHRRFLKTHLPVDALVYSPKAKYIYVGRDGRDIVWSLYNHHANANARWYEALNETPGRVGPPIEPPPEDIRKYWRDWLDHDGYPFWSFWENVRSWWSIRELPNLMLLHYNDLKRDMPLQMRRIASFLNIPVNESQWDRIVKYCSFEWMKANAHKSTPMGGAFWDAGAQVFINQGINSRWRDVLTESEISEYEARAERELGTDCAFWLAHGESAEAGQ